MREVIVEIKVKAIISIDDDIELGEVIDGMDYDFTDTTTKADVIDCEMIDYEVIDNNYNF